MVETNMKNRKYFASLKAAKDFCNINNRSGEDIMEMQKSLRSPDPTCLPDEVASRYAKGFPIYLVD